MEEIRTDHVPQPIGPYSQAVKAGNLVFISGQIGIDSKTGQFAGKTAALQATQVLENLREILVAAGSSLENVVETTVYLSDMNDFAEMNKVYAKYFIGAVRPARSTVEVAALPKGAKIEIKATAQIKAK